MKEIIQQLDFSLLYSLRNAIQCPFLDFLMPKITMLGNGGCVWLAAACLLLLQPKHRRTGILLLVGLAAGVLIGNVVMKPLFARPRPCWIDTTGEMLVAVPRDFWPYAFLRHRGDDPVACGASLRHRRHTARGTDRLVTAVPVRTLSDRHSRLRCHRYSSRRVGVEIRRSLIASGRVYAAAPEGILKRQKYRQAWQASYPKERLPCFFAHG